jgi:fructokinase
MILPRSLGALPKWDVVGTGLAVIDRIYTGAASQPQESLGGSCANVLLALGSLRHSVAPILALGADREGDFLTSQFSAVGICTEFIRQHENRLTPIIAQHLVPDAAQHWFSFVCPTTGIPYPKFTPVDFTGITNSQRALTSCRVFYLDRLSPANVWAMECAFNNGAITILELPNWDSPLLQRAMRVARIVKHSDDARGSDAISQDVFPDVAIVRTHGANGLTLKGHGYEIHLPAVQARSVIDTCGAGDMVSVGLIDRILRQSATPTDLSLNLLVEGLQAGQRLAASNCGYVGARGFLEECGVEAVESLLY